MMNARMSGEELDGLIDAHHQYIADAPALEFDRERLLIETATAAHIATDAHVR
jgi:hypothetical protein